LAMVGLLGLVVIFGAGIFAGTVAPYSYAAIDLSHILQGPTHAHYFGTDALGRDQYTRVLWGIRTSMEVGVFVAFVSTVVGLIVGAIAGYYGGWLDNLLMRFTDLVLTLPLLSFLGFGIKPPTPSLGVLVNDAQANPEQWWLTVFPGLTIVLIVLCVNFVGDGLRDALDPTQRRVRA